jgi:hypothetical protein
MGLKRRLAVSLDMARRIGIRPTAEMLRTTAHQKFHQWRWKADFRRLGFDDQPVERDVLGSRMKLEPSKAGLDRELLLHGMREPIATGHLMHVLTAC